MNRVRCHRSIEQALIPVPVEPSCAGGLVDSDFLGLGVGQLRTLAFDDRFLEFGFVAVFYLPLFG